MISYSENLIRDTTSRHADFLIFSCLEVGFVYLFNHHFYVIVDGEGPYVNLKDMHTGYIFPE